MENLLETITIIKVMAAMALKNKYAIYDDAMHGLQYHMLTKEKVVKPKNEIPRDMHKPNPKDTNKPKNEIPKDIYIPKPPIKPSMYIPQEVNDTLFWCYYILKHGMHAFELMQHKNIVVEKQIKIGMVTSMLRNNKQISKKLKLDTLGNLEGNLGNDNLLTLATFFTLCAIDQIPVMYVHKKCYFMVGDFDIEEDDDLKEINVIEKRIINAKKTIYGFKQISREEQIRLTHMLYKLPSLHSNPLKGISSYTMEDLRAIREKLGLANKKLLKNEMYDSIVQEISSSN